MTQKDDLESNALVKRASKGLMTSKSRRSQISLTSDIIRAAAIARTSSQALGDESWMQEIWEWADNFGIDEDTIPRNRLALSALVAMEFIYKTFDSLPESIGNLSNLKSLDIYSGSLTLLPESIGKLNKLKSFELDVENLRSLPNSIGRLVNLTCLKVHKHNIISLPESIGNLHNLKILDFFSGGSADFSEESFSSLMSLPESIGNLSKLKILDIGKNNELC